MRNFDYYNPVKILFGKGKIAEIDEMDSERNESYDDLRWWKHQEKRCL